MKINSRGGARLLISLAMSAALLASILAGARLASSAASQARLLEWSEPPRDPEVGAIAITSPLVYDPAPGGLTRTVYFNNRQPGTITVTVAITGTPTLTLTGAAAFSNTAPTVITASVAPFTGVITYAVGVHHDTQPGVLFTATNAHSLSAAAPITFVRDVTAPVGGISHPPAGWGAFTTTLVTGTAQDAGAGIRQVQVLTGAGGAAHAAAYSALDGTWVYTWSAPFEDGVGHQLLVTATDWVGNVLTATRAITVDNVAPGGTVIFTANLPVNQWVNAPALYVQWAGFSDGGAIANYQYLLTNTSSFSLPSTAGTSTPIAQMTETLNEGQWYLHVAAQDAAGNWSATHFTGPFLADKTPPTSAISAPAAGAVLTVAAGSPYNVMGGAHDTGGSGLQVITVTVDGNVLCAPSASPWTCAWPLTGVDSTTFTLQSRAQDNAGNLQIAPDEVSVVVDMVAPAAAAPTVPGAPWTPTTTLTFTWPASSDAAGILRYELLITDTMAGLTQTRAVIAPVTHYISPTASEGHSYQAALRALDRNGNAGAWSGPSAVITPDVTNPVVNYGSPPIPLATGRVYVVGPSWYYSSSTLNSVTLEVTATDNLSLAQVTASAAPAGWYGPVAVPMLPPTWRFWYAQNNVNSNPSGVLTVMARDAAGCTTTRAFTYTFDRVAPAASIVAAPLYVSDTARLITVTYRATDTQSGIGQVRVYYRRNGGSWTSGAVKLYNAYAQTVNDVAGVLVPGDGRYEWRAVAVDNLGNTPGEPVGDGDRVTFYDATAPTTTVTAPLITGDSPINVNWTAGDATAGVSAVALWIRPPGGVWGRTLYSDTTGAVSGTFAYVPTAGDGEYSFYVQAIDRAGNAMPEPTVAQASTTFGAAAPTTDADVPGPYANYTPITVTWRATSTAVNLQAITLCLSATLGGWRETNYVYTGAMTTTAGGVFLFAPAQEGRYDFAIAAQTVTRKRLPCPTSGPGSASILYDTFVAAPFALNLAPSGWTRTNAFTITWNNPADLSGIARTFFKIGAPPASGQDGTSILGAVTSVTVTAPGDGRHPVYLWLQDQAGNSGWTRAPSVTLRLDSSPPVTPLIQVAARPVTPTFSVAWSAVDVTSGVISYTLEYSSARLAAWQVVTGTALTRTLLTVPFTDMAYLLRVTAFDAAGNSAQSTKAIYVGMHRIFLPVVLQTFPPPWRVGAGMDANIRVYSLAACTGTLSNTVYAGTLERGVYKSTDAGAKWTATGGALSAETVYGVATANCAVVYATTWGKGVYKSTDGGASWNPANSGLNGLAAFLYSIALDRANANTLYLGTADGVYKSTDGGGRWASAGLAGKYVFGVSVDPKQSQTVYAALWTSSGDVTIYKTSDGGESWQPLGLSGVTVYIVQVDPSNSNHLLAATANGLYRSINNGINWTRIGPQATSLWVTADVYSRQFFAGYGNLGVWRSADGQNWVAFDYGLRGAACTVNVVEAGATYFYAGTNDRVWRYPRLP